MSTAATKKAPAQTSAEPATKQLARSTAAPLADLRPASVAQRKLQQDIQNSPRAQQAMVQPQALAGSRPQPAPVQKKENKTGLPDNLKSGVENLSGHSLDDVKVHYNSAKPAELQAHAYAQGADIHVAPGQEKHLPHEAWHIAQQKQGRVKPTMQMKGNVAVNDDAGLEREADAMGQKAFGAPKATTQLRVQTTPAAAPAQLVKDESRRPVLDARINELKQETINILSTMKALGVDWETQYGKKGKEKGSNILGKKTDYRAEIRRAALKEFWASLTTEEKLDMVVEGGRLTGKVIGAAARGGREVVRALPESEKEDKGKEEAKPQEKREEPAPSVSWLSGLTQEQVEAVYEAYSRVNDVLKQYARAKAKVQETAGEIGESVGSEVGKLRDEADFNKRMAALRQEFFVARTRLKLLEAAIEDNKDSTRYEVELDALANGLMNKIHGPAMVYDRDLSEQGRKEHPTVCQNAIAAIRLSSHGDILESGLSLLKWVEEKVGDAIDGGKGKEQAVKNAQNELARELDTVLDKSWGGVTKWRSMPAGVKTIKSALPKQGSSPAKLREAARLARGARGGKSDNRSAETQIFYDALANMTITDLQSLKVTKSIIEDVGTRLR